MIAEPWIELYDVVQNDPCFSDHGIRPESSHLVELAKLARNQAGVFTRRQALDCGFTWRQIQGKLRRGEWVHVMGKALSMAGTPVTVETLESAALLSAGTHAVLSGASAAARHHWDIRGPRPCITIPTSQRLSLPGVLILRADLPDADVDVVDCVGVTSELRTVLDCLRLLPYEHAAAVLDRALQKNLVDFDVLCGRVRDLVGQRGTPKLVKLVKEANLGTRSEAERRLCALIRRAGITGWKTNFHIFDVAGLIGEVDVAFPDVRLAIEVDGRAWHSAADRFEWDRRKQNRLELAGWKVLRFTWEEITRRPEKVTADIKRMLTLLGMRL